MIGEAALGVEVLAGPELGDLVTGFAMVGSALVTWVERGGLGSGDTKEENTLCPVPKILTVLGFRLLETVLATPRPGITGLEAEVITAATLGTVLVG